MELYNANPLVDMWIWDASRDRLLQEMAQRLPAIFESEFQNPIFWHSSSNVLAVIEKPCRSARWPFQLPLVQAVMRYKAVTNKAARYTTV